MTSKYQKNAFPIENLGKMKQISFIDHNGKWDVIDYQKLKLVIQNGQLCFSYEESNLLMPIARLTTIHKLEQDLENG